LFLSSCNSSSGGGSSLSLDRLGKVRAHEALEVEVGELILLLELEKSGKLGIGVNLAAILVVLKLVGADVSVDVAGHGSARHLSALLLAKEGGKLIADASGLDKARGLAVARLALTLGALLLGSLELALPLLLKRLVLALEGRDKGSKLLELGIKLGGLLNNGGLKGLTLNGGGNGSHINNGGGGGLNRGGLGSLRGLGLGGLCRGSSSGNILNNGGSGGSVGLLASSYHTILYLGD